MNVGAWTVGFDSIGEFQQLGGSIQACYVEIGANATSKGKMVQSGGTVIIDNALKPSWAGGMTLGRDAGSIGSYEIKGPIETKITTFFLDVGSRGQGTFTQENGTVQVGCPLYVGRYATGNGSYTFNNGNLTAGFVSVGNHGTGSFTQNGGVLTLTGFTYDSTVYPGDLMVGSRFGDSNGTYNLNGGKIYAENLMVGNSDPAGTGIGQMNINNAAAQVFVSNSFTIGARGQFTAAPDVTINMTGSNFYNNSTNPANVDMTGLRMFFSNNPGSADTFEVAGTNLAGFTNNFALGTLELVGLIVGTGGKLTLVDAFDNNKSGTLLDEVLYVTDLKLGDHSTLDLNNLHLYCLHLTLGSDVQFLNGTPQVVPLPSTLLLLASGLGGLALAGRRRFRKG